MPFVATKLNPEDVEAMLQKLCKVVDSGDNEIAHSIEDEMIVTVLSAIAEGTCDDPQRCAQIALRSQDITIAGTLRELRALVCLGDLYDH